MGDDAARTVHADDAQPFIGDGHANRPFILRKDVHFVGLRIVECGARRIDDVGFVFGELLGPICSGNPFAGRTHIVGVTGTYDAIHEGVVRIGAGSGVVYLHGLEFAYLVAHPAGSALPVPPDEAGIQSFPGGAVDDATVQAASAALVRSDL